ncbi:MAG: thiamine-phosphate diphosphorylase [Nitrospirae bacterium GWC1_57_7]|nr:MAG: thiamine-phosphate diphosphorylase [Nitrospirae bacterium GWC1_57_7]
MLSAETSLAIDFKLYLITDRHAAKIPLPQAVRAALEGGVRAVQLREKDLPIRELLKLAGELRRITKEYGARLFINDRVDVAVAVDADGMHLGGESIPVDAVRRIVGDKMLIGVSTHSLSEAVEAAQRGADFITFGPAFETPSKKKYGPPVGLGPIAEIKKAIRIPVFALGGITVSNVSAVIDAGVDGIGLISAILAADDITAAAKNILATIDRSGQAIRREQRDGAAVG